MFVWFSAKWMTKMEGQIVYAVKAEWICEKRGGRPLTPADFTTNAQWMVHTQVRSTGMMNSTF